jgi:hypothetical protein
MRHARSLEFDGLEARKLLSRAHAPVVHHAVKAEVATVPLVLNGTLTVDNKAAQETSTNGFGGETISTPVSGVLSGVGKVHGQWNENLGSFGDYLGANVLVLQNKQGSFMISFGTENAKNSTRTAKGFIFAPIPQHIVSPTGAYAHSAETGSIVLNTNASRELVLNMSLSSATT